MTEQPITRTKAWLESLRPKTFPLAFSANIVGT
ncbi:1,4-dihydroxy-2-naphthoate polyprenyltransferase, partial [Enterobacter hormaechei]